MRLLPAGGYINLVTRGIFQASISLLSFYLNINIQQACLNCIHSHSSAFNSLLSRRASLLFSSLSPKHYTQPPIMVSRRPFLQNASRMCPTSDTNMLYCRPTEQFQRLELSLYESLRPRQTAQLRLDDNADSAPIQLNKYLKLDQQGKIMAEYVWIDSTGGTRSKSRVCTASFSLILTPVGCIVHRPA